MKTMTQLCESIMDGLDNQYTTLSNVLANVTKLVERPIEDYPYQLMFIMWEEHKLYKERLKMKKDIIVYLQLNPLIKIFSDVKFDVERDAADTTFYVGFEHNIRTVSQFYRLFTGTVNYMRKYINVDNYEFVIRNNVEERDLCRIDYDDFVLFRQLQTTRHLEDYEDTVERITLFVSACEEFLGLSDTEATKQTESLFNIRIEREPEYDAIDKIYLNEEKQLKTMTQLCEGIIDDLDKDDTPAALKLVRTAIKRKNEIKDAVTDLLNIIKDINRLIDNIDDLKEDDKICFKLDVKICLPNYDELIFGQGLLDIPDRFDKVCEQIYEIYNKRVQSEYQWWFDRSDRREELYDKFENFIDRWYRRNRDDEHNEILLQGEYDMNCVYFKKRRPVTLLREMKIWADKAYRAFIITKLDPESIYYDD